MEACRRHSTIRLHDRAKLYTLTFGNTGIHLQYSLNGGDDWTQLDSYPGWIAFGVAPGPPGRLYGALQVRGQIVRSDDSGGSWRQLGVRDGVATTCGLARFMASGLPTPSRTPIYPEDALLILLDTDPTPEVVAVPLTHEAVALLIALVGVTSLPMFGERKQRIGTRGVT